MALKAIDFFCGIGGVTRGFLNKGIDVVAGIDIDISCKETYEKNNIRPNGTASKFLAEDITNFAIEKVKKLLSPDDTLVLIGCAPCQPFTRITQKLENREKERGLLQHFAEVILELKPIYLFLENVQGLNSPKNKEILNEFIEALKPHYILNPKVINAMNYGVPQSRRRMILFAKKDAEIDYPKQTHGNKEGLQKIITLDRVIADLPEIKAGEQHSELKTHISANLQEINLERIKLQTNPGDGMEKWTPDLYLHSRKNNDYVGHKDVYARLWWDRPSITLTTKFVSVSNGRFAHPTQNRGLSILEGLLIQTFPKDYQMLYPFVRGQAKQIGNAVPVKLAEAFAEKILEAENHKFSVASQPNLPLLI